MPTAAAQAALDGISNALQYRITKGVAVEVIDLFEMVDVYKQHRDGHVEPFAVFMQGRAFLKKIVAV